MKPERIQLSRRKGWRLPPNTVVVSRPSRWGNPFRVRKHTEQKDSPWAVETQAEAVRQFRRWLKLYGAGLNHHAIKTQLRGKNLACWCKPGTPCHADVLLEIANA